NWARVMAQIVYYGYASLRFGSSAPVSFCVPTGNFGNVFAGYLARRMGFPIDRLIVATNANDILSVFFGTGRYQRGSVHHTMSPAMDIQVASNFERYLYYHFGEDAARLNAFMETFARSGCASIDPEADGGQRVSDVLLATAVTEQETRDTIGRVYRDCGYVADPHTAVGLAAAERFATAGTKVCIATAHPAKFPESVNQAVGKPVATHPALEALKGLESRRTVIPATVAAVRDYLQAHARA
ncbi:MAG: threonine synthase, partial [Pseudomonadales bacterium]|nr:threonine synthase [Pseudomonadales bacterium]